MSRIRCGPKIDGVRIEVSRACNTRCSFYEQCIKELGIPKPEYEIIELEPTARELEAGIGHLTRGEIKVWHRVKI